jgi:ribonucleoside-diphosphate reductase alpha chain
MTNVYETQTGIRFSTSQNVVLDTAKQYAVLDKGSQEKRFTDEAFTLTKDSQSALLRGLFTADGTVANYGDKSQYISLGSRSRGILQQVQLLLL